MYACKKIFLCPRNIFHKENINIVLNYWDIIITANYYKIYVIFIGIYVYIYVHMF